MSKNKELIRNTLIIFLGVFFTKIIQYFLLPIYTGYLSSAEYGEYELYNTIITLLYPIIGLQIDQGVFRFLVKNRKSSKEKDIIISTSFFSTLILNILLIILFFIISPLISFEYKYLLLFNLILTNLSSFFNQISRGLGDNTSYSISGFLISLFTIAFNILFIVSIGMKCDGLLLGGIIGYFIGVLFIFFRLKLYKYISFKKIRKKYLKEILRYSIPLIPNSISWWLIASSDRMIVASTLGLSETGLLSIAYKFSNIGIIIYNVFYMSMSESLSLHVDDDDISEYFNKIYNQISSLFSGILSIIIATMPILFSLLINKSYNDSYSLVSVAILASAFQIYAGLYSTIYIAYQGTKSIAITSLISAIINVAVDLILINYIGVFAAVVSTLISFIFLYIFRHFDINKKYFKIAISKKFILSNIILILLSGLFFLKNNYITIISIVFSVLFFIYINKNYIITLYKKIKLRGLK